MAETTRELIERAVYAALGCTDMASFDSASKQIASFVIDELAQAHMAIYFIGARQGCGPGLGTGATSQAAIYRSQ